MHNSIRFILAGLLATGMVACAKKVKEEPTPVSDAVAPVETAPVDGAGRYSATDLDRVPCLMQRVVYFDFDRAEIRGEAQEILRCHAKYLNDNATSRMTLEGHADDEGNAHILDFEDATTEDLERLRGLLREAGFAGVAVKQHSPVHGTVVVAEGRPEGEEGD